MIDFLKYKKFGFIVSVVLLVLSLYAIVINGFNYSIEFVGGSVIEYQLPKQLKEQEVKGIVNELGIEISELSLNDSILYLRAKPISEGKEASLQATLNQKVKDSQIEILRSETIGPAVSKDLVEKTVIALIFGVLVIFGYITFAFKDFRFAVAAIVALVHDVFILLGIYSWMSHYFGAEVDTLLITAVLTTLSLSIHDTIVIFDKVREHKKYAESKDIEVVSNKALIETLIRSVNSSMTTAFMLISLALLGGDSIRYFIVALLTGIIVGTYSSPFVAVPVMVWLEKRKTVSN
jgi:preprotein translocase subunit SecF